MSKVYLAVDNCFASKRWVTPGEWSAILADLGVHCVEASADVELDPLHMDHTYLMRWEEQMRRASEQYGVNVANFFTGHGTYVTSGLLHPDAGVRHRIREEWLGETARRAGRFGAGLGFFVHAVPQRDLIDPEAYHIRKGELLEELVLIAEQAGSVPELTTVSLEQMYSPQQPPWRIEETLELLRQVYNRSEGYPLYTTLDVGHGGPQQRFIRPSAETLEQAVETMRGNREPLSGRRLPYLGGRHLEDKLRSLIALGEPTKRVVEEFAPLLEEQEHLFATPTDADPYAWLEALAPYSPVVHLQQTDGVTSAHRPFTPEENREGVIEPKKVLQALRRGFEKVSRERPGGGDGAEASGGNLLPPPVERVYLTLELFFSTASYPEQILDELRQSVRAWREVIPEDGLELEELLSR